MSVRRDQIAFDARHATLTAFLFRLFPDDGTFTDLQKRFLRALDDKTRIFDLFDPSDHTTVGNDFIIDLQGVDHFLQLLLLAFLGKDDQKIKNTDHHQDRKKNADGAKDAATSVLKKKQ